MFQTDLAVLSTTLPSVMPRQPDVVLKDVGERVAWKSTGIFTNSHAMLLVQIHNRRFHSKQLLASPILPPQWGAADVEI